MFGCFHRLGERCAGQQFLVFGFQSVYLHGHLLGRGFKQRGTLFSGGNGGFLAADGFLRDYQRTRHDFIRRFINPCNHVATRLADAWKHLAAHPILELFRFFLAALEDALVQVGFGDEIELLNAAIGKGWNNTPPLL